MTTHVVNAAPGVAAPLRNFPMILRLLAFLGLFPALLSARSPFPSDWLATTDLWGNPSHQRMTLTLEGDRLAGELDGDALTGTLRDGEVRMTIQVAGGAPSELRGTYADGEIAGTIFQSEGEGPSGRQEHRFRARPIPVRPAGPPRRHEFAPSTFSNLFSASVPPILTIWPGDTVHTSTIDSGGVDAAGVTRALYGNPQTGPFYVETAWPGDVLAVHLKRLRLDRDWADSLDAIASRGLGPRLAARASGLGKGVRWKLDRERGVATPEGATGALAGYTVPLRPMLGGLAVAPGFGWPPFSTGDTGRFGGNMDLNEVVEGVTVYLPVEQPGALLYLGDGHAAQGDGELTEWALETSLDVEFSVEVLPGRALSGPRVESPTHLMALGQAGSLDDAFRAATAGLAQWLEQDYGLTLSEVAQILGTSAEYRVATVVGRNAGVVAKIAKERLAGLPRRAAP